MLSGASSAAAPAPALLPPPPSPQVGSFSLAMLGGAWEGVRSLASDAERLSQESVAMLSRGHLECARTLASRSAAASLELSRSCLHPSLVWGPPPLRPKEMRRLVRRSARPSAPRSGTSYERSFEPSFEVAPASQVLFRDLPEDYLAFVSTLPSQLQVEEGPKVVASRRLAALMSDTQLASVTGLAEVEFASCGRVGAVGLFVSFAARKWSSSYMHQLANVWIDVMKFSRSTCRPMVQGSFTGAFVQAYMARVELRARLGWLARHPGPSDAHFGAAKGSTARGGAGSKLRTLAGALLFPIVVSSLAAREATRRTKRAGRRKRSCTERVQLKLERLAALGPSWPVRVCAAGLAALGLEAVRHASACRFALIRAPPLVAAPLPPSVSPAYREYVAASGGSVHGMVLTDPKAATDDGIPAVTSARGISGSRAWLDVLLQVQGSMTTRSLVYAVASPDGEQVTDPFQASQILDTAPSSVQSTRVLHALLLSDVCAPSFTPEILVGLTPHSSKHLLSSISRNSFDRKEVTNEIGKWSGSASQNEALPCAGEVPLPRSDAPSSKSHITDVYSHEALGDGGSVAVVMELQIARARRRLASVSSCEDLPAIGGFGYYSTLE